MNNSDQEAKSSAPTDGTPAYRYLPYTTHYVVLGDECVSIHLVTYTAEDLPPMASQDALATAIGCYSAGLAAIWLDARHSDEVLRNTIRHELCHAMLTSFHGDTIDFESESQTNLLSNLVKDFKCQIDDANVWLEESHDMRVQFKCFEGGFTPLPSSSESPQCQRHLGVPVFTGGTASGWRFAVQRVRNER